MNSFAPSGIKGVLSFAYPRDHGFNYGIDFMLSVLPTEDWMPHPFLP